MAGLAFAALAAIGFASAGQAQEKKFKIGVIYDYSGPLAGGGSSLHGLGAVGDTMLSMGGQLLTLKFSREDETEADIVGMDLAARAGYDPAAGITLWQKMMAANKRAPPEFMSTHPAGDTRIRDIGEKLPKVQPLFAQAGKPPRRFAPPAAASRRS